MGHETLLLCGANIIAESPEGKILLQKRRDTGLWGYCGGSMEPDERAEDAARRELLEETGLSAGNLELIGVYSGPDFHIRYPNGDDVSYVEIVFRCTDYVGELTPQEEEVTELEYFPLTQLPSEMMPSSQLVLKDYMRKKKEGAF
mgnify:CR=1 FL=1